MTKRYERIFSIFFCHWISTLGVVITTASALMFLGFQFMESDNPYHSLIAFVAVPVVFLAGLILIPAGLAIRARQAGGVRPVLDSTEWSSHRIVRLAFVVVVATGANLALMSTASYRAADYLNSDAFCGTVCHVMEPQWEAYQQSPHARVGCVDCHVGPGASSFLTAKLEGAGRLAAMVTGYDPPVRISEENRRRAAMTCANCHRETTGEAISLRMIREFDSDEPSTPRITLLTMYVDQAIHPAHASGRVRYIASEAGRDLVPWISAGGEAFISGETPTGDPEDMTCVDCHNRVGHEFESVEQAVNRAIAQGLLARSLPFARRDAVAALEGDTAFPEAANALEEILADNVFPEQGVDWNTYPSWMGHTDGGGCFRCHDGQHVSEAGNTVSQNCFGCHALVAVGEENPTILEELGVEP